MSRPSTEATLSEPPNQSWGEVFAAAYDDFVRQLGAKFDLSLHDAESVIQSGALKVARYLARGGVVTKAMKSFLWTAIRSEALDLIRRRDGAESRVVLVDISALDGVVERGAHGGASTDGNGAPDHEAQRLMAAALAELTDAERTLVLRIARDGESQRSVARAMGFGENHKKVGAQFVAAKARLIRLYRELERKWDGDGPA